MNGAKKDVATVHVPIEPSGANPTGTIHFSQGLLPSSCWLVVPASTFVHPQVPVPQIQVMNSVDYMKIIEIACSDLALTVKLKHLKKKNSTGTGTARDYMDAIKEQMDRNRAYAMLSGGPSPSHSLSPISMSPRASNDR
ncbi:unnamed protein product [Caenorhabditis sp. 36 PRJEB53466]|nr:unnamed protein product [Caenorhabditis sp. 36 PRJEB53466]